MGTWTTTVPACNGICVMAYEVLPGYAGVAHAHPECDVHGDDPLMPLHDVPEMCGVWVYGKVYLVGYHRPGYHYSFGGALTFETELWRGNEGDNGPFPTVVPSDTWVSRVRRRTP